MTSDLLTSDLLTSDLLIPDPSGPKVMRSKTMDTSSPSLSQRLKGFLTSPTTRRKKQPSPKPAHADRTSPKPKPASPLPPLGQASVRAASLPKNFRDRTHSVEDWEEGDGWGPEGDCGDEIPLLPKRSYTPDDLGLEEAPPLPPRRYSWSDMEDNDDEVWIPLRRTPLPPSLRLTPLPRSCSPPSPTHTLSPPPLRLSPLSCSCSPSSPARAHPPPPLRLSPLPHSGSPPSLLMVSSLAQALPPSLLMFMLSPTPRSCSPPSPLMLAPPLSCSPSAGASK